MTERSFFDIIEEILDQDPSYRREAYLFVMQALDHAVSQKREGGHVSGQELLRGVVDLARDQFGPLAHAVLHEWGLRTSLDVGRVVFHLVEKKLLGRKEEDRLEDFEGGLDIAAELEPGEG